MAIAATMWVTDELGVSAQNTTQAESNGGSMAMMMVLGLSAAVVATSFISGILGMAGGMILMGILSPP